MNKIILQNRPYDNAYAQYNFDNTYGLLGSPPDVNLQDEVLEIFTTVESKVTILDSTHPDFVSGGVLWNWRGSQIEFIEMDTEDNDNPESDGGRYTGVKFAIYMYDLEGESPTLATFQDSDSGNKIRDDIIGEGSSFRNNGVRIGYYGSFNQKQDKSIGDVINENNALYNGSVDWDSTLTIFDFPKNPYLQTGDSTYFLYGGDKWGWNTDLVDWTKSLTSDIGNFWIILRGAGDERETIWPFGTKTDERDRIYCSLKFSKENLQKYWIRSYGDTKTYGWSSPTTNVNENVDLDNDLWNERDRYGDSNGHNEWGDNTGPINQFKSLAIRINYPQWTPEIAEMSQIDGGWNAKWVNYIDNHNTWWAVQGVGLNPSYNIDYYNWPENFYNDLELMQSEQKWFLENLIPDWRPISTIFTYYTDESLNKDLQSYQQPGTLDAVYASAPNNVKLKFDLTPEPVSSGFTEDLSVIDLTTGIHNNFKYWFMVVNWDWKDGDKGGGVCSSTDTEITCLDELSFTFPTSEDELIGFNNSNNTFRLASLTQAEGFDDYLTHQYAEPGIKIVKALVFNTVDYWHESQGDNPYYGKYRQAVDWKLVTIKLNLTDESFSGEDFSDVGGGDFTFIPYPEQIIYNGENDYPEHKSVNGSFYKSSHPMIGGLSEDSVYVKNLEMMNQQSPSIFSTREGSQLRTLKKAINNVPGGSMDELGKFTGNADISQVRFFNGNKKENYNCTFEDINTSNTIYHDKCQELDNVQVGDTIEIDRSIDIYDFLNLNPEIENDFKYYNDNEYWNGIDNGFPLESSITDIFINGDEHLNDYCIFEFNCWSHENGSILDSSGNGNKGILIGDYSIKKENKNKPVVKASNVELPKISTSKKDGAF